MRKIGYDVMKEEPKADWKQWLPVYGMYQVYQDMKARKPLASKSILFAVYHVVAETTAFIGALKGIELLVNKL